MDPVTDDFVAWDDIALLDVFSEDVAADEGSDLIVDTSTDVVSVDVRVAVVVLDVSLDVVSIVVRVAVVVVLDVSLDVVSVDVRVVDAVLDVSLDVVSVDVSVVVVLDVFFDEVSSEIDINCKCLFRDFLCCPMC